MTINQLFTQYLHPNSDVDNCINILSQLIDEDLSSDITNEYYNVNDNEIRGFFDNDNFYITRINDYELPQFTQFDY